MRRHSIFRILGTALALVLLLAVGFESVGARHHHDSAFDSHCVACHVAANHAGIAPAPNVHGAPPLPDPHHPLGPVPGLTPGSRHRDAVYLRGPPTV